MGRLPHRAHRHGSATQSERGDTIVEVMISLIIISLIITGAFLVSRTSSQNIRSSQEHAEALQLLQGQVEMLRAQATAAAPGSTWTPPAASFCMDESTGTAVAAGPSGPCNIQNNGSAYTYDMSITKASVSSDNDISLPANKANSAGFGETYVFSVSWDAVAGGQNHESIIYRVPKS